MNNTQIALLRELKSSKSNIVGCYTYCKEDKSLSGKRVLLKNLDAFDNTFNADPSNPLVGLRFVMSIDKEQSFKDIEFLDTFKQFAELCEMDVLEPEWKPLVQTKGSRKGSTTVAVFVYPDAL